MYIKLNNKKQNIYTIINIRGRFLVYFYSSAPSKSTPLFITYTPYLVMFRPTLIEIPSLRPK